MARHNQLFALVGMILLIIVHGIDSCGIWGSHKSKTVLKKIEVQQDHPPQFMTLDAQQQQRLPRPEAHQQHQQAMKREAQYPPMINSQNPNIRMEGARRSIRLEADDQHPVSNSHSRYVIQCSSCVKYMQIIYCTHSTPCNRGGLHNCKLPVAANCPCGFETKLPHPVSHPDFIHNCKKCYIKPVPNLN
ncbi:hypothetical protein MJO28_008525 [Puccinia striiformis f. sp. tritici]|uniref:Uncharacterized protein n=4 Tax=Puccinia striiformis TaxID=27350 RepID=A0A0L0VG80_9BASI|nr:hypothetical protein Pst134EA_015402 [Puccinia striiformis f. sp. tritici]KAI9602859.1 hypothetical protein H4Q26_002165 [Puccinia striiformis f. sp. tritici PST-130]KNE98211.1 hypothetical protein PSTG_08479 [Puccinia striiformis f. sp. tritici PST-78]POW04560.1 hypothetical protein PSTT_10296 [Puccinia striiformis]KAH9452561.1 hypothetical protein Pst134EB_016512 [Puccinia striiformis f. sp. tritici]KAH9463318.1 hypothetical protein Pst134EA_015402 [Puccinia striiformis f. sp. tritici]